MSHNGSVAPGQADAPVTAAAPTAAAPAPAAAAAAAAPVAAKPAFAFSLTPKPLQLTPQPIVPAPLANSDAAAAMAAAMMAPIAQPSGAAAPQPAFSLQPKPLTLQPQPLTLQPQPNHNDSAPSAVAPAPAAAPAAAAPAAVAAPVAVAAPAAAAPAPAVAASASGVSAPPCPVVSLNLPIVDDDAALEQCQEWSFFVELLDDVFNDQAKTISALEATIAANDHLQFQKEAHALKGAALNLHLPALSDITKKAEIVGKQLVITPHVAEYLAARQAMLEHLKLEYARLQAVLPIYRQRAEEAEAAGEGGDEDYGDDGQQPQYNEQGYA